MEWNIQNVEQFQKIKIHIIVISEGEKYKKAEEIFAILNINGWEHSKLITNTKPVLQEAQETSY